METHLLANIGSCLRCQRLHGFHITYTNTAGSNITTCVVWLGDQNIPRFPTNLFRFWFGSSTSSTSHYRHITALPPSTDKRSAVYAPQLHDGNALNSHFCFWGELAKDLFHIKTETRLLLWDKAWSTSTISCRLHTRRLFISSVVLHWFKQTQLTGELRLAEWDRRQTLSLDWETLLTRAVLWKTQKGEQKIVVFPPPFFLLFFF